MCASGGDSGPKEAPYSLPIFLNESHETPFFLPSFPLSSPLPPLPPQKKNEEKKKGYLGIVNKAVELINRDRGGQIADVA